MVSHASDITPKPAPSAEPPTCDRPGLCHSLSTCTCVAAVSCVCYAFQKKCTWRGTSSSHLLPFSCQVMSSFSSPTHARKQSKAGSTDSIRVKSCTCNPISRAHLISSREPTTLLPSSARFSTLRALPGRRSVLVVIDWRSGQARRGGKAMMGSGGSSSNCRFQT